MALFEELGRDLQEVTTGGGTARLWWLTPTIYVTQVSGQMGEKHADLFERFAEERIRNAPGKVNVFHDWLGMTGYESRCRQRLTRWSLEHLDAYGEVHLALRSKLVAMGVQVANIALGGKIRVHGSRATLEAELKRALGPAFVAAR